MESNVEIKFCEDFGEFLVSNVDIEEGQMILVESPLFTSPGELKSVDRVCCVTCVKVLNSSTDLMTEFESKCPRCKWPVCGPNCAQDAIHQAECSVFSKNEVKYSKAANLYLKVVRIFLAKDLPEFQSFMRLSSNIESCNEPFPEVLNAEAKEAYDFVRNLCKMDVTYDAVFKVLSILKINRFTIEAENASESYYGHAVFGVASKFSHSCAPNLEWRTHRKDCDCTGSNRWELHVYTKSKIQKGDTLSIPYTLIGVKRDTLRRRKAFSRKMPFNCLCSRCKSPTEEGTYFGSPLCKICSNGNMVAMEALDCGSCIWKCEECSECLPAEEILRQVSNLELEINNLLKTTPTPTALIDQFIEQNSGKTLNKNHFLLLRACECWLFKGNFTETLLANGEESRKLFEKIEERAARINIVGEKFYPTFAMMGLNYHMAIRTAEFVFKSSDHYTIEQLFSNEHEKLRYAEKVLSYLTKSLQWAELNPQTKDIIKHCEYLRLLQNAWASNILAGESNWCFKHIFENSLPIYVFGFIIITVALLILTYKFCVALITSML